MGFLRRWLGGTGERDDAVGPEDGPAPADLVAEEQARERELLRDEARRLDDDLLQRQLRYADRSWTPPAQGGPRRADETEGAGGPEGSNGPG